MGERDPTTRLRLLADAAAEFSIDCNIPIRRYFRSGQEMIKMAEVYHNEGSLEAAYVLYMKYMTLFVEKLKNHKDFGQVLPAEKKRVRGVVKDVMGKTEELKMILKSRFGEEHSVWLKEEQVRKWEEQREQARKEEEKREAERKRQEEVASIERDRQVAMWHQAQLDKEDRESRGVGHPSVGEVPAYTPSQVDRVTYDPTKYTDTPSAPADLDHGLPSYDSVRPMSVSPPPSYDRTAKPAPPTFTPSTSLPAPSTSSTPSVPTFDRSAKPVITAPTGLRTIVIPGDLSEAFLAVAKANSDRGVETLGTLGGHLAKNRFVISHLLIPRQEGKSDSCTMEGLEDVWDVHDKENIIFLGWVHTHPAYSVFLSSVDMHNQYEWQHMLPEALAIVCSIKDNVVGNLRLSQAGMAEIGGCSLTNFHPHSKEPPLWEEAPHVEVDRTKSVILKDLR
eukprot:TRINITY_DN9162_c0_g1_i1.p1 TRINITY_DN9162_c0_g1~~TRINITY_DN9162_c0_g1_i1.p1  ORF type:complete len:449 (+),score=183.73 TRINITY_DN9162_c0_g1_i1:173-1519(+)